MNAIDRGKAMGNGSLKIVYLLPAGLFNSGGMERVTTIKANYLAELGHDVSIVTTEQMGRPVFYPLSAKVHLYHLDIGIYCNFGKENYWQKCISRYRKTKGYKKRLTHLLLELRPDITVSTLGLDIGFINDLNDGSIKIGELHFPGNFRQLMARKLSIRFLPNYIARIRTGELRKKCSQLDRLVVLTKEEQSAWEGYHNVEVIPNPLPFVPDRISGLEEKKAIAVGRLVYEKGFDLLIRSWKIVAGKYPDWQLDIFGNGEEKEKLQQMIISNGMQDVIFVHDAVNNISERYCDHSLLVFPSRYLEALPMVLIEAMSCGVPPVAFLCKCGPRDIITDGVDGFLAEVGNTDELAAKICALIASEELRKSMGNAARRHSLGYTVERVMPQWLKLFNDLTEGFPENTSNDLAGVRTARLDGNPYPNATTPPTTNPE